MARCNSQRQLQQDGWAQQYFSDRAAHRAAEDAAGLQAAIDAARREPKHDVRPPGRAWTAAEDDALVWAHALYGKRKRWRWDAIAKQLPGRTAVAAKAHWAASPHLRAEAAQQQMAKAEERAKVTEEERQQAAMALLTPGVSDLR